MPLVWLDASDSWLAKVRLGELRTKLADRAWVRFSEEDYEPAKAMKSLVTELSLNSLFNPGKVVYTYGLPSFQAKLIKKLEEMDSAVVFVLIAEVDKSSAFYKGLGDAGIKYKVDEQEKLVQKDAVAWVKARAAAMDAVIDETSCKMIIDIVGLDMNKISNELDKLRNFADGKIMPWIVQEAVYGHGDAQVTSLFQYILDGSPEQAHEMLHRLFTRDGARVTERIMKFFGYPMDWVRRLAIVSSSRVFDDAIKDKVGKIKKWTDGESAPMFANPKGLYFSFKNLSESGRSPQWVFDFMVKLGELQETFRMKGIDDEREALAMLHAFIDKVI